MNKKILVIDDEEAIQEVIKIVLECEGYATRTLGSGEKLMDKITNDLPDVILLDFSLPGETGDVIARKLRSQVITSKIPIIMLSAHHAVAQLAQSCGVNAFLAKPFSINELLGIIEEYSHISMSS